MTEKEKAEESRKSFKILESKGSNYFKDKEYLKAVDCFKGALEIVYSKNHEYEVIILSNIG